MIIDELQLIVVNQRHGNGKGNGGVGLLKRTAAENWKWQKLKTEVKVMGHQISSGRIKPCWQRHCAQNHFDANSGTDASADADANTDADADSNTEAMPATNFRLSNHESIRHLASEQKAPNPADALSCQDISRLHLSSANKLTLSPNVTWHFGAIYLYLILFHYLSSAN